MRILSARLVGPTALVLLIPMIGAAQFHDLPVPLPTEDTIETTWSLGAVVCSSGDRALAANSGRFRIYDGQLEPMTPTDTVYNPEPFFREPLCTPSRHGFDLLFRDDTYGWSIASIDGETGELVKAPIVSVDGAGGPVHHFAEVNDGWFVLTTATEWPKYGEQLQGVFIDREGLATKKFPIGTDDFLNQVAAARYNEQTFLVAHATLDFDHGGLLRVFEVSTSGVGKEEEVAHVRTGDNVRMASSGDGRVLLVITRQEGRIELYWLDGARVISKSTHSIGRRFASSVALSVFKDGFVLGSSDGIIQITGDRISEVDAKGSHFVTSVAPFNGGVLTTEWYGGMVFYRPTLDAEPIKVRFNEQFVDPRATAIAITSDRIATGWKMGTGRVELTDRSGVRVSDSLQPGGRVLSLIAQQNIFFAFVASAGRAPTVGVSRISPDGVLLDGSPHALDLSLTGPFSVAATPGGFVASAFEQAGHSPQRSPLLHLVSIDMNGHVTARRTYTTVRDEGPYTMQVGEFSQWLVHGDGTNLLVWVADQMECRIGGCPPHQFQLHARLLGDDLREIAAFDLGWKRAHTVRWTGYGFEINTGEEILSITTAGVLHNEPRTTTMHPYITVLAWAGERFFGVRDSRPVVGRFSQKHGFHDVEIVGPEVTSVAGGFDALGNVSYAYSEYDSQLRRDLRFIRPAVAPSYVDVAVDLERFDAPGERLRFRITVTNYSYGFARNVAVRVTHPSGGHVLTSGNLLCRGDDASQTRCGKSIMAPGARETIDLVVRSKSGWNVDATVHAEGIDLYPANNRSTVAVTAN